MKNIRSVIAILLALSISAPGIVAAGGMTPLAKDKCAVCGMFVAKYPDWSAMIEYRSGRRVWFDGSKDLLKGYLAPAKYNLPKDHAEMKAIWVKDYYSLALIDGRKAYYVIGSNILGPMGKELIPFAKENDAKGFLKDHQGEKIFRFEQLTAAVLEKLDQ